MTLRDIHDLELALLDPCIAMSERGVRVDETRRLRIIADLDATLGPLTAELQALVVPRLKRAKRLPRAHLFRPKLKKSELAACCAAHGIQREKWPVKAALERYLARRGGFWTFNPMSDDQAKVVLYDVLKLPKRVKDGKSRSDEEALKSLLAHDKSGIVRGLLSLAKQATMRSILERIAPGEDGRIRSFYNPAGAETGRFSSAESFLVRSTNLQNLPKREAVEDRFDVRRCLVPDDGEVFVEADLSGAEAWVTAACCGDIELLARLRGGEDIHRWTAAHIYGKDARHVTDIERFLGKTARHALNYGMQAGTFQRRINADAEQSAITVTRRDVERIAQAYHRLHPLLEVWYHSVFDLLAAARTLSTCFGRRRVFFGRFGGAGAGWLGETHREAIAYEPQSTVADLLNRGLLRWWRQHDGKVGRLLMQVHDSVVLGVPKRQAKLTAALLRRCLEEEIEVHGQRITIPVDVSVSEVSWGEMRKAA